METWKCSYKTIYITRRAANTGYQYMFLIGFNCSALSGISRPSVSPTRHQHAALGPHGRQWFWLLLTHYILFIVILKQQNSSKVIKHDFTFSLVGERWPLWWVGLSDWEMVFLMVCFGLVRKRLVRTPGAKLICWCADWLNYRINTTLLQADWFKFRNLLN